MLLKNAKIAAALLLLIGLVIWAIWRFEKPQTAQLARAEVGLVTSLPIYWAEGASVGDMLASEDNAHWVRAFLEERYKLIPLDSLVAAGAGAKAMSKLRRLILAQPRAFAPAELAALDQWVREGGHVLIFSDPMLTEESQFPLGDPRGPERTSMLDPLLEHWGLRLQIDLAQPSEEQEVAMDAAENVFVPVILGGEFVALNKGSARCTIGKNSLIATCKVGKGTAVLLADAALLEKNARNLSARERALDSILRAASF